MSHDAKGWGFPGQSRKAHYFENGTSLCGKWGFFYGFISDDKHDHPDNCVQCKRRYAKRHDRAPAAEDAHGGES